MVSKPREKQLNKEQLEAIKYKNGPLLIIAGAGSGKTTVITERIKYLIEKKLARPNEILALTFTDKASREMEERVDIAVPYGYTQMWIMTFHSFCDRVLRSEALHIGLDPKYKLATGAEIVQLVRNNLFKFDLNYFRPLGNPTKFIEGMLQHFSRLQDENISPNDYIAWVQKQRKSKATQDEKLEIEKWKELSKAYRTYEELKVQFNFLDFGDLITKTLKLFRQRPNILAQYQKQFKYILIDEFQDTNYAQNELAILLAGKEKNITVCGDDDQSIYRFRGAAVSNIVQFRKNFPKVKIVVLTRNYRSTQEILDRAYSLIQSNNPDRLEVIEKVDKKLVSQRKIKGDSIRFIHVDRVENEADAVAKEVRNLIQKEKYDFKDFAILVRANNHAEPFTRALGRHGIPYQFLGPGRLFKQPEVIDLISYLRVLYNFEDSPSFYRVLSMDIFDIPAREIASLGNYARKHNISLFEAAEKSENEKIQKIVNLVKKQLGLIKKESAGQILYYFLEETGLLESLLDIKDPGVEKKATNISKFFDKLKTYEVDHADANIFSVVDWIDLSMDLGESPKASDSDWTEVNAVNILTVHSAKGLEFPVVFLVNLTSGRFPTIERREQIPIPDPLIKEMLPKGDYHLEEERRLFYVGMTRAKDVLVFSSADYYGEGKREKKLSPFIFEALGDKALESEQKGKEGQPSFLDYSNKHKEPKFQAQKIHVDYLSYSQIETFRICPLHYKLKYIYNVPTPPSSSQSFGNSFHLTMKAFYESVIKGEKATLPLFYKSLKENWIGEGYLNKSHEMKSFEKAKKFLKYYLKNIFDPKITPIAMEQPFLIRLNNLRVGGKIDRIDSYKDTIEIIDYKTGANPITQRQAQKDLQLSIYALAATSIPEFPFNRAPEKVKLSLYYFDTPSIITTTRTRKELVKARETIEDFKNQIEKSDFKCSGNILCKSCEYKLICQSDS